MELGLGCRRASYRSVNERGLSHRDYMRALAVETLPAFEGQVLL